MQRSLERLQTITWMREEDYPRLSTMVQQRDCSIFELNGAHIWDKLSFWREARAVLPQDPPFNGGWDAFNDSLWGGLLTLTTPLAIVLWREADRMLDGGLPDLFMAATCFEDVVSGMVKAEHGSPRVRLMVFLLGSGPNFRPLISLLPEVVGE